MRFLNDHVFTTPNWLLQKEILSNIEPSGAVTGIRNMQARFLNGLLRKDRLERLIENEALNGSKAYTLVEMLSDLRKGLWSELTTTKDIDAFRRNLQRAHVERLAELLEQDKENRSDISAAARAELKTIQSSARSAGSRYRTGMVQNHLRDIDAWIDETLKAD
jgi:hypothetical protein